MGAGQVGALLARHFIERAEFGLCPVGFLDAEPLESPVDTGGVPLIAANWDIGTVLRDFQIEHVVSPRPDLWTGSLVGDWVSDRRGEELTRRDAPLP